MASLADLRVVELGRFIGAAYGARLLGDFGAEVIKIEAPDGCGLRMAGPFAGDEPAPDGGGLHLALDGGKRSVALDLADEAGRAMAARLIGDADVFITDFPPAELRGIGFDAASLAQRHPRLIAIGLSIFGDGPEAGHPACDLDAMAMSGIAHCIGMPGREPLALPYSQSAFQLGVNGAAAAILALIARGRGGVGQAADIAAADVMASYLGTMALILICHNTGRMDRSGHRACGDAGTYPYVMLPCRDGLVQLIGRSRAEWEGLLAAMGNPAWAVDPRYRDLRAMAAGYAAEVDERIKPWLAARSRSALLELAGQYGFTLAPVRTMDEVLATAQFQGRGYFGVVRHPRLGRITLPGVPYRLSATPARAPRLASDLDGDGAEIRARGFSTPAGAAAPYDPPADPAAPLAGIRVLDFGWVWSGPMVTALLSEFGADVIRVEHRGRLDLNRMLGRPIGMTKEVRPGPSIEFTPLFHQTNHNKRGITLNTKDPRGVDLVKRLAAHCDVVLENMNPGAMERAGLGYAALRAVNPSIVMVAMSAVGQEGPLKAMRAYAPIMASFVGMESQIGYPGEAPIGGLNFGLGDPNAAMHTLFALLVALHHRAATGEGQFIDVSQCEALLSVLAEPMMDYVLNRRLSPPPGNTDPRAAPHGIFPAAGTDRWLSIAVGDDAAWRALAAVMGHPAWAGEAALATAAGRLRQRERIEGLLAAWTAGFDRDDLAARLRAAGIAASPVLSASEQWAHPYFLTRRIRQRIEHPLSGPEDLYAAPWRMSVSRPVIRSSAPLLGQHNAEVLGGLLGMGDDEIAALVEAGVIA